MTIVIDGAIFSGGYGIYADVVGQQAYTTAGTYTWIAPENVTSVSVVAIGGGGSGATNYSGQTAGGGAGGGLGWKNNITVVPGQSYTVVVGAGGIAPTQSGSRNGLPGGNSYFINTSTVCGFGGAGAYYNNETGNIVGGSYTGDGGGEGGTNIAGGSGEGGGTGAGGYAGTGGAGGNSSSSANSYFDSRGRAGTGGAAGGAAVGVGSGKGGGGGGGVGILGQGTSGADTIYNSTGGYGGNAGSGGSKGSDQGVKGTGIGGDGGSYGGGGGGSINSKPAAGDGASGAVRIIWGTGRAFPSTNTQNM